MNFFCLTAEGLERINSEAPIVAYGRVFLPFVLPNRVAIKRGLGHQESTGVHKCKNTDRGEMDSLLFILG